MTPSGEIEKVGIVGAGLVGSGWAVVFALAGLQVRVFDPDQAIAQKVLELAGCAMADMDAVGLATNINAALERISVCDSMAEAVGDADYVQESAFERVDLKTDVSTQIGALIRPDAIVGSSSSGIPASVFTKSVRHRERFLIVHPVNPPHVVPVVELVPTPWTAPDVVPVARAFMERVGQVPVVVTREIEGFLLNRLQGALLNEAFALLEEGYASAADIDATVSYGLGLRWSFMGPFETIDLNAPGGLDDYARRLEPLYHSVAESRKDPRGWSASLVDKANSERRNILPKDDLPARREWRDRMLMRLVSHLRSSRAADT